MREKNRLWMFTVIEVNNIDLQKFANKSSSK